jgi:hypothetical protein
MGPLTSGFTWCTRTDQKPQPSDASMFVKRPLDCRCLGGERGAGVEGAVELAGDVALEAPLDLTAGLAFGCATGDVVLGGGQHRMRVMAMVWIALFRARSPPRLSRCRTVLPLLACNGLVPDSAANAASLRHRPGREKDTMA